MASIRRLAPVGFVLCAVLACGEPGTDPEPCDDGSLPPCTHSVTIPISMNISGIANIGSVTVEVTGPGISSPIVVNLTISGGSAAGSVTVPTGSARTFTVRVFDTGSIETHRGTVTVDIVDGSAPTLSLTLLPLTESVPIDVVFGIITLALDPASISVMVGDTVELTATVTDADGNLVSVAVHWASTNPGHASVTADGLVIAHSIGFAQIVITYAGFAGTADVAVTSGEVGVFYDEATFRSESGALAAVVYPVPRGLTAAAYSENGISLASAAGHVNLVNDLTADLDGNEFSVSGAENIDVHLAVPVVAIGFWMEDMVAGDTAGCAGADSQFELTFLAGNAEVARFDYDPAPNIASFVGIIPKVPIDGVEIREIGSTYDQNDPLCENDYLGRIFTSTSLP